MGGWLGEEEGSSYIRGAIFQETKIIGLFLTCSSQREATTTLRMQLVDGFNRDIVYVLHTE